MRKILILSLLILFFSQVIWTQKNESAFNEVVAAEKAFAVMAAAQNTRAAFLEFAAPDAVVFGDKPENARAAWEKRAASSSLLAWSPAWADVSADGVLGYTTGGWEFRLKGAADAPAAWGEYFTIWKKQPDGRWKFELDLGIEHSSVPLATDWDSPASPSKGKNAGQSQTTWQDVELKFSETLRNERAAGVYQKLAEEDIRFLREGHLPVIGKKSALALIPPEDLTLKTRALGGAATGDFIYSYGEYWQVQKGTNERGYFARVWKRVPQGWRITLDIAHPVPPEPK